MSGGARLLFVSHAAELGGAEQVNLQVTRDLCERGWAVTWAGPEDGPLPDLARDAGAAFRSMPLSRTSSAFPRPSYFRSVAALARCVRATNTQCLIATSTPALNWCGPLGRALRLPVVLTLHDADLAFPAGLYLRSATHVITPATLTARLARRHGFDASHIFQIPNGVAPSPERPARSFEPVAGTPFTVGFVGRLHPMKGVALMVAAAEELDDEVRVRIVGAPFSDSVDDLPRRCAALVARRRLELTGFLRGEALIEAMASLDVLVLPSYRELSPLTVLEAMALGVPVVATDVGETSALVEHERTGLLIDRGSAGAIVSAVRRLRGDPALRARLRAGGLAKAGQHSLATMQGAYRAALEPIANQAPGVFASSARNQPRAR